MRLTSVFLMFESPPYAGGMIIPSISSVSTFLQFSRYTEALLVMTCFVGVLIMLIGAYDSVFAYGALFFSESAHFIDCFLYSVLTLFTVCSLLKESLESEILYAVTLESQMIPPNIASIMYVAGVQQLTISVAVFLAWARFMYSIFFLKRCVYCAYFVRFHFSQSFSLFTLSFFILVKTVESMMLALVRGFFVLVIMIFFAFSLFDYVNFGASRASSSTLWRAMSHQYSRLHGGFEFTAGSMVLFSFPMIEHTSGALLVVFSVLVVIVLLNLALTIVLEVYNASEENNDTVWAEQQASELLFYRNRCFNACIHTVSKCMYALKKNKSVRSTETDDTAGEPDFDLLDLPDVDQISTDIHRKRSLSTAGHVLLNDSVRRVRQSAHSFNGGRLGQHLENLQVAGKDKLSDRAYRIENPMNVEMGVLLQESPLNGSGAGSGNDWVIGGYSDGSDSSSNGGIPWYVNSATGESTWTQPASLSAGHYSGVSFSDDGAGGGGGAYGAGEYFECYSGDTPYYVHTVTNESVWELPQGAKLAQASTAVDL